MSKMVRLITNQTKLLNSDGDLVGFSAVHLHSKTVGLLFVDTGSKDPSLRHLLDFYTRTNGVHRETLKSDGTRGHSVEFVTVPVNGSNTPSMQHEFGRRFPWVSLHGDCEEERKSFISSFCSGDDVIYPRLVIVNYDGSLISDNGIVEIVSKGDSCLMGWQMVRKADPIDPNDGVGDMVVPEPKEKKAKTGTSKSFGGVQVELPF